MDGPSVFGLPYRVVYAVASQDTITIFDTQHEYAIATVVGLHYHHITDITWVVQVPKDASNAEPTFSLVVSSLDGYCSFIRFSTGELGPELCEKDVPEVISTPRMPMSLVCTMTLGTTSYMAYTNLCYYNSPAGYEA